MFELHHIQNNEVNLNVLRRVEKFNGLIMQKIIYVVTFLLFFASCSSQEIAEEIKSENEMKFEIDKTEQEWKKLLKEEEFRVLRLKGTERPHTGEYNLHFKDGKYTCRGCGNILFESDTKFNSHCGWPSFSDVVDTNAIKEIPDYSYGMIRTEVVCSKCGGHLGHVFNDGPTPTGLRYCINSVSINFVEENKDSKNE